MKLEYTLTLNDFRELSAHINPVPRGQKPIMQVIIWLVLFFLILVNVYLNGLVASAQPNGGSRTVTNLPVQNLWVCLSPQLLITTFLLFSVIFTPLRSNTLQVQNKGQSRTLRIAGLLSLLSGVWMIPIQFPGMAINWRPTEGQLIWASFAPWSLYFATVRPILAFRRKRLVDRAWASRPSMHRIQRMDISQTGIKLEDGLLATQYKWACFKTYGETPNLLLLINIDDVPGVVIPKRAVSDDRAMDEMKMLISENIAEGQFRLKQNAFPVIVADNGSPSGRVEQ